MPVSAAPEDNLIHGLSDFWVTLFRDSDRLRDVYAAQAVQYGQLYLDLLDAVLGASLEHVPLFSRTYFKDFYVREDSLLFVEGPSVDDDLWVHVTEEKLSDVTWLMNRVVCPTAVVEPRRDYVVVEGALAFKSNPFSSALYAAFPVRMVDVVYPAAARGSWFSARPGDTARYTPRGGPPVYARVRGVSDGLLLLDRHVPEFTSVSGGTLSVLRAPFDATKSAQPVSTQPSSVSPVTVRAVGGTRRLELLGADSSWIGTYVAFADVDEPRNSGFHRVNSLWVGGVEVDAPGVFMDSTHQPGYHVDLGGDLGATPVARVPHANLRAGTLRLHGRAANGVGLAPGVDYVADETTGALRILSAWDASSTATASYEWDAVVDQATYVDASQFVKDHVARTREMSLWGADVLVDKDALYQNFGYLLGFKRDSSERYREFLRGVSQLYLLGSNASRFESALNVMAGYPVVREDGESLVRYDDGVAASGTGTISDFREGRDGTLTSGTSQFSSPTAAFGPGDVGAMLSARVGLSSTRHAVSSVVSPTVAVVSPAPPDATNVEWSYRHVATRGRFVSDAPAFTDSVVGAYLVLRNTRNARNNGSFRVTAVESPCVVFLDAPLGLADESAVTWQLTRSREVRVVTNRRTYVFPFGTPMRPDVVAGGPISFDAYEALTEAFEVVSEQIDPTWWHRAYIPREVLEDVDPASRYVSTSLVEHVLDAVDAPRFGDPDLYVGLDDEGAAPPPREGDGLWLGGPWVRAHEALTPRDVGRYVVVTTAPYEGSFRVEAVLPDNVTMRLERFPPPEARNATAPSAVRVRLPAVIFRRPVPFILMDRFLKRHAIAVRVHPDAHVSPELMADAAQIVKEARPSHAHVYMESLAKMRDDVSLGETFGATIRPGLVDTLAFPDTGWSLSSAPFINFGDAYTYVEETFSVAHGGGTTTVTLTPAAPYPAPYRWVFLAGRFLNGTVTIGPHTRDIAEGADYSFNRVTGELQITRGNAATLSFATLSCFVRTRADTDPLLDYETRLSVGGADPSVAAPGAVDRAISIRLS